MPVNTSATNNGDTFIRSNLASGNLDGTDLKLGWRDTDPIDHILISFTLPSGTGTISKVALFLKLQSYDEATATSISVHQLSRGFGETTATWNKYDGTNNWTTAGGDYNATAIDSTSVGSSIGTFYEWDLYGGSSDNPITLTWGDTVNLLLKRQSESGSVVTKNFYAKNTGSSGDRPYLEITYSEAYTLTASSASYALTGQTTLFYLAWKLIAVYGSYTYTGIAAVLKYGRTLGAAVGTFALTGLNAIFLLGRRFTAAVGMIAVTGYSVTFSIARHLQLTNAVFTAVGFQARLLINGITQYYQNKFTAQSTSYADKHTSQSTTYSDKLSSQSNTYTNKF